VHVLVVGGNRFVGYELAFRLLAGGHRVTLLNRGTRPDPFAGRVERLTGDRSAGGFARLVGKRTFDAVVDFAVFHGDEAAEAAAALEGRVGHYVMISTGQVYLVRVPRPSPARESDYDGPLMAAPESAAEKEQWDYGFGKRAAEDVLAAAWKESRFPSTRLRLPMVNGERDYHRRLEGYLWRLLDGGPLILPDGGDRPTRHVYGGAVARAIAALLGNAATFGQAYNLAQDETPTAREILTIAADLLGARAQFVTVPAGDIDKAGLDVVAVSAFSGRWMSFLDPARARAELAFRHEPLREYLGRIVAAFVAHPPSAPPEGLARRAEEIALAAGRG
jgi:nucleoside-diphosphate-sugar epimerase